MMIKSNKQDKMFSLVEQFNEGKLTILQIREQHNITKDSFRYWREKYASQNIKKQEISKLFLPLVVEQEKSQQSTIPITLTYPNGVQITLGGAMNLQIIQQLIHLA